MGHNSGDHRLTSTSSLVRFKPDRPLVGWFAIGVYFLVMWALGQVANGQERRPPPLIQDFPARLRTVEMPPPPTIEFRNSAPADGPMCSAPVPSEDGPGSQVGWLTMEVPTQAEAVEVELQIAKCSRKVRKVADPYLVLAVYRLEADLGVPPEARGILGAAWCWEAAMRGQPKPGDEGKSHGAFQMQSWFFAWCGLPTTDETKFNLPVVATCFASRIQHYLDDGKCPGNFARAEAMAANGRKYALYGCKAQSLHLSELERWRAHGQPKRTTPQATQ